MLNEPQLIKLLKNRDKRGLSVLYDRYSAALYGVALRIVRSEPVAEDVLQEAFIKIWKSSQSYDSKKGTLFTWMLNITRNTAIDKTRSAHYRSNGKIQPLEDFVNGSERVPVTEQSIEHIGLREKVDKLEVKYRTIVDMIYFEGYTQAEVAEKMDLPLGTVKTRVRIALRELRKVFVETKRVLPLLFVLWFDMM